MFNTKKTDIEITKAKAAELKGMVGEALASKKTLESFHEPNDRFQAKMGEIVIREAKVMETIEKETKDVTERHPAICDFYLLDKTDDMRKSSVDFFGMWREFFKNVDNACPKEEKKRITKKGGLDKKAAEAMKAQIAELQALQAKNKK